MLSPQAMRPLLRYFTAIDEAVSERLTRTQPWDEIALTHLLCDLLDEEAQRGYRVRRDAAWLRNRLDSALPLASVRFSIEAHQYPSPIERWVNQSDLGVVIRFEDRLVPGRDWEAASLLQAKRLFPISAREYGLASRYDSHSKAQHQRMLDLNEHLGYDLVHYLLYVPRPEWLDPMVAAELRHLRDVNIQDRIFDYAEGLELHREVRRTGASLDAGIGVTQAATLPKTLRSTYADLFNNSLPWCWFLTSPLTNWLGRYEQQEMLPTLSASTDPARHKKLVGLVTGDLEVVEEVIVAMGWSDRDPIPFLNARSITVFVTVGGD